MIPLTITVDDRRIVARFDNLPRQLKQNLHRAITEITEMMAVRVRAAEPRRTGRLLSLTRSFVDERPNWIRGRVRILGTAQQRHNIAAAALEYGANATVSVRAYRRGGAPVRSYRRRTHIAARRFLRGPAAELRGVARAAIEAAVAEALRQA
jgi:hypothetical protein